MKLRQKPKFGIICSVMPKSAQEMMGIFRHLRSECRAHTLEIRLDALSKKECQDVVSNLSGNLLFPATILTRRSCEQGGLWNAGCEEQWYFWKNLPRTLHRLVADENMQVFVDFDIELLHWARTEFEILPFLGGKIITSYHDFEGNKSAGELLAILNKMRATRAGFFKIVSTAQTADAVAKIQALFYGHSLAVNRGDSRPLISFLMGKEGVQTIRLCLA